jgi:hypothetical protein
MTAGLNCRSAIWRWLYLEDDEVGGATPTGTYIYNDVGSFIQEQKAEQLLLQQGLEIQRVFWATIVPAWYIIKEGDEFEVTSPSDHAFIGDRFRIIHRTYSSHNRRDPRGYIMLDMIRSEETHEHQ